MKGYRFCGLERGESTLWKDNVNWGPLFGWVVAAVSAPLAQFSGNGSWTGTLISGIICGITCWMVYKTNPVFPEWNNVLYGLELLWLAVAAGGMALWSSQVWPKGNGTQVIPVTLLLLAAASAWEGGGRASRTGGTIFWLLAILYSVLLAAGIKNLNWQYLVPKQERISWQLIAALLIPGSGIFLPRSNAKKKTGAFCVAGSLLGGVFSLWTVGILSPAVAQKQSFAIYEASKSLNLLGIAERFEAFLSVAVTMGYFALFSLLFSEVGHLGERIRPNSGRPSVAACAAVSVGIVAFLMEIPGWIMAVGNGLFWLVIPCICTPIWKRKKSQKGEKSA